MTAQIERMQDKNNTTMFHLFHGPHQKHYIFSLHRGLIEKEPPPPPPPPNPNPNPYVELHTRGNQF